MEHNIREVKAEEDPFGSELMALLEKYDINTFIFSGVGGNKGGITSLNFENTQLGVTALALLVRAVPELFLIFEEAKLGAYVTMITEMLERGNPAVGKFSDEPEDRKEQNQADLLKNYTVTGKLKN